MRLLSFDSWTIVFWRSIFAGCIVTVFLLLTQRRQGLSELLWMRRGGWLFAVLSTIGMTAFIPALQLTSAANVAVISATAPFMAAGLAWVWFAEAPKPRTLFASAIALAGVALIVGGATAAGDVRGIGLTLVMALAFAAMTAAVRRYRDTSMVAAAAMSNVLGCIVSLPFAGGIADVTLHDLWLFAAFGGLQVALGLIFFVFGTRLLPSAQASLLATLEMPLMPVWIWLIFSEVPATHQLIGGAIVLAAVVFDTAGDLRAWGSAEREAAKPPLPSENLP